MEFPIILNLCIVFLHYFFDQIDESKKDQSWSKNERIRIDQNPDRKGRQTHSAQKDQKVDQNKNNFQNIDQVFHIFLFRFLFNFCVQKLEK